MARDAGRGAKPLRRRVANRTPRKTLVVFCEGERTEPEYLEALKREPDVRGIASVELQIHSQRNGTKPLELVKAAASAKTRSDQEEGEVDEFWCVFDVEWPQNHSNLREAIDIAERNGIYLAISNPCFELWLALHFIECDRWLDNKGARNLRRSCDKQGDKGISPSLYMNLRSSAAQRASKLDVRHKHNGVTFPNNNPSSGMHRLIATVTPSRSTTPR